MGPKTLMTGLSMVIESRPLGKGFAAVQASVGFVPGVNPGMGLQSGRFPKGFAANFTAIGPLPVVLSGMTDHGGLVPELFRTDGALVRFFARMLAEMIVQVDPGFEGFVARGTGEISDIFVVRSDVGGQPAGLGKGFAAVLATNLATFKEWQIVKKHTSYDLREI